MGSPSRAHTLASLLDASPKAFTLASERGFLTITGRYKGVPVSIMSIGMVSYRLCISYLILSLFLFPLHGTLPTRPLNEVCSHARL